MPLYRRVSHRYLNTLFHYTVFRWEENKRKIEIQSVKMISKNLILIFNFFRIRLQTISFNKTYHGYRVHKLLIY